MGRYHLQTKLRCQTFEVESGEKWDWGCRCMVKGNIFLAGQEGL